MNFKHILGFFLAALVAGAQAHQLTNGRITVVQPDGAAGKVNNDWITALTWVDSSGNVISNFVSNGGTLCGDGREFFGQSYDEGDGAGLFMVIAGSFSKWKQKASGLSGVATTTGTDACYALSGVTRTAYMLFTTPAKISALRIQRKFTFNAHALDEPFNLRGYVPRLPLSAYATVLVPSTTGTVQVFNAGSCASACQITNWNGKWFADDDGTGHGMAVIRDKSSTWPAVIAMDNDSISASNNTSILLLKPTGGWTGSVTETEYLCFYDPVSWPAASRAAGKLPKGCAVPTP